MDLDHGRARAAPPPVYHGAMFRSAGAAGTDGAATARRIKEWVREVLAPGDEVTILVSELACSEPGCPPIETVIALFRGRDDTTKYTIHRPSAEITREDIAGLSAPHA
jgi:hypothetical protein